MAKVEKLLTKPERLKREVAQRIADQLKLFPEQDLPAIHREGLLTALQKITAPDTERSLWPGGYVMLSKVQVAAIWSAIRQLPGKDRPSQVRHAFDLVLLNQRVDSSEIAITRDEMAEAMGIKAADVSRVMGVLERMGVVVRERRRVPGLRGRGIAVYAINPHVAWNGSLEIRRVRAAEIEPPSVDAVTVRAPRRRRAQLALVPTSAE